MPPIDGTEALGMGAVVVATPFIVEHIKNAVRGQPWPLVASLVSVALSVWLYYAGTLPTATTPVEAALAGFLAAVLSRRGYDAVQAAPSIQFVKNGGERESRYDGVVVEEG